MNRSLSEKKGSKKKYFREQEQHFYKQLCKGLVYSGDSRDIGAWQGHRVCGR